MHCVLGRARKARDSRTVIPSGRESTLPLMRGLAARGRARGPTGPDPSRQGPSGRPICRGEPGSRAAARVATEIKVLRTAAVLEEREEVCFSPPR
ncbi:hypothetical protein AAFF_G00093530 [Aldrovandia affinis]|uniref:Uncharacterized protein n=1 Tax=Aldrovandia affinis TaxID=143900 RepID=A0AAD7T2T6_9TELE|nr:hypothetical protein AAFF_G00093530 [Aldrovandia affinis]